MGIRKIYIYILLFAVLLIDINCIGKRVLKSFKKTYGGVSMDFGNSVDQTSDGGYILLGVSKKFDAGTEDMSLIKTDAFGNELWNKKFGASGNDRGRSVQQTSDGGYILFGSGYSYTGRGWDMYLIKTDAAGNEIWSRQFGGKKNDKGYYVRQTSDGGYILLGHSESFSVGGSDVYVVKTNKEGREVWSKTFGGSGYDYGRCVQETSDGGFIIIGRTASFSVKGWDMYLVKTDNKGEILWSKTFGGNSDDFGRAVYQTSDGGYILLGYTWSFGAGGWDMYLVKTSDKGRMLWSKTYGGEKDDFGVSIQQTTDKGFILLGRTNSFGAGEFDIYLIKTDKNGSEEWNRTFGDASDDSGVSVMQTSDGGYILVGYTSYFGAGENDIYLIKTNSYGMLE